MKKLMSLILSLALFMNPMMVFAQEQEDSITIYHTNDLHGYVTSSDSTIGLGKIASLKEMKADSILVDAGDATQGLPIASLSKGADIISLMNTAGYDVMAVGNHEFDFGIDNLLKNKSLATFPMLGANVSYNGDSVLESSTVVERGEYKIGFFGLVTKDTATSTNPSGIQGVAFADEIKTAREQVEYLESQDVDAIVGIVHCGEQSGGASTTAQDIAQDVAGIDVLIDGHSHKEENEAVTNKETGETTLIVQTGSNGAKVGELTLTFEENGEVNAAETLLGVENVANIEENAAVKAQLEEINASLSEKLSVEIAQSDMTLWAGSLGDGIAITRVVETNLGDLVADAFKAKAQEIAGNSLPVVAVENGGGIRGKFSNGSITQGDLVTAFPFSNTVVLKTVTPKDLYGIMQEGASYLDGQDPRTGMLLQLANSGSFMQVSGMQVVYNSQAASVESITLDGQTTPLDPEDTTTKIMLATNNYVADSKLPGIEKYAEAGSELETIQEYLQKADLRQYHQTQGRIQFTGSEYKPKDYQATVQILDKEGQPFANQSVQFMVDGTESMEARTDAKGYALLTLEDGSHSVRLKSGTEEVYVDNYSGFGIIEGNYRGSFPVLGTSATPEEEIPSEEETTILSNASGVKVEIPASVAEGMELIVARIYEGLDNIKAAITKLVKIDGDKIAVYDLAFTKNGSDYDFNKQFEAKVMIPVPEDWDPESLALYYYSDETNTATEIACQIKNGFVEFNTDHFSYYVLVQKDNGKEDPDQTQKPESSTEDKKEDPKTEEGSKTSEQTNSTLYVLLLAVSGVVLILIGKYLNKKDK